MSQTPNKEDNEFHIQVIMDRINRRWEVRLSKLKYLTALTGVNSWIDARSQLGWLSNQ